MLRNFLLYLRKMALNDIDEMFDTIRRIKSGDDMYDYMVYEILRFEVVLRLSRTFIEHHHIFLPGSLVEITKKIKHVAEHLHIVEELHIVEQHLHLRWRVSLLLKFLEGNTTLRCSYKLKASNLLEYMDCLGVNLDDVVMRLKLYESDDLNRILKQVKIVRKKMRSLRYLYAVEINGNVNLEKVEGLETRIQFLLDNVAWFCLTFWIKDRMTLKNEVKDYILNESPYQLCLVMLVQLEMQKSFHGERKTSKFCQLKMFKNQKMPKYFSHHLHRLLMYLRKTKLENFHNNLSTPYMDEAIEFLLFFLVDVPNQFIGDKMLNEVLKKVGTIVGDVLFVIQKLLPNSMIKDDTIKITLCLISIVEETEKLKVQEEKYYKSLKFTHSHEFPTVDGLSFQDSLLRKLNDILESESSLNLMMKPHISILKKELSFLTSIFRHVAKVHHENKFFKDHQRRTSNLAYEVEVSVDSILAQCNPLWHVFCSLPAILKELKHISEEVIEMWLKNRDVIPIVNSSTHLPTVYIDPLTDEEIVGFENDADKIIRYLIGGTKDRDVIPIVGMGGQGKTTISRKVFNNCRVVSHFDVRAWCCISQTYNRIDLLREIHGQVSKSKIVFKDSELVDMLRKELMGKRYLIVLDDMWDVKAWEDLGPSFPDCAKGSRIIVTTRELEKVAAEIKHYTDPFSLPFLTTEESSELLQKKVFQKESCPPQLIHASLEVAKKCKGLPLTVVLVAGIIKRKKTQASWWHEVKDSLQSYFGQCEEKSIFSTLQLSYDNLPYHIRPCLLYMGMFLEDARIPVSKLISLWIAEGFVPSTESGRLEEAAEGYLMNLISSNMVMILKRRYNGKVKYCKVHDVVHHFCMEMGRKEKFMLAVKGRCSQFKPCDSKVSRLSFNFIDKLSEIALLVPKAQNPYHQQLRSLITTTSRGYFLDANPFQQIIKLRLLRVLDFGSHNVGHFSSATLNPLIHLKYLAAHFDNFDFHPESLLLNLETMILRCPRISVPTMFWKMKKLRLVDISKAEFDLKNNKQQMMEEFSKLKNLRILRKVVFHIDDSKDYMDVLFDRCPNLEELHINVYGGSEQVSLSFTKLESLTHLTLYCKRSILSELHFPLNMKKLSLEYPDVVTKTSWITMLPSLEFLKLQDSVYGSDVWYLGDDIKFPKLKCLKLRGLGISRWDASEESFPMLETLVIKGCHRIKDIPPCFEDISTLKKIELIRCYNKSLNASTLKIKKEVEECEGFDRIDVIIDGKLVREYENLSNQDLGSTCNIWVQNMRMLLQGVS